MFNTSHIVCSTLAAMSLIAMTPAANAADVSLNGGWSSSYVFRGVPQAASSAFGGIDIEHSGLYLGTWIADVGRSGQGLEVDLYGGYSGKLNEFSYGIGGTSYTYTDDFDDEYFEINLNGKYSQFSLDVALGEYRNFSGPTLDYQYYTLAAEHRKVYTGISFWGGDYAGAVLELGYNSTLTVGGTQLIDYSVVAIHSSEVAVAGSPLAGTDTSYALSISKEIDL